MQQNATLSAGAVRSAKTVKNYLPLIGWGIVFASVVAMFVLLVLSEGADDSATYDRGLFFAGLAAAAGWVMTAPEEKGGAA